MKKLTDIKKKMVQRAGLAPEAAGSTRTIVIDDTNVFLENHKGIREFGQNKVHIDLGEKEIVIEGSGLKLDEFGKNCASVSGVIKTLRFENNERRALR